MTLLCWFENGPRPLRFHHKDFHQHRVGFWRPKNRQLIAAWVNQLMQRVREEPNRELDPSLRQFKDAVTGNPTLNRFATGMFDEVPYDEDPAGRPAIRDFDEMLQAINQILKEAPSWTEADYRVGFIGTPINLILEWPMITPSGFAFFLSPEVNKCFAEILSTWANYLSTLDSARVLAAPHGWFGPHGLRVLTAKGNENGFRAPTTAAFAELYQCPDPADPVTYGFASWDAFFTRALRPAARPVAAPADDAVVVHACESAPSQHPVAHVRRTDRFFAKGQPYSLVHMLHDDPLVARFVGGTVYQAFLSALSYHRWHAPVAGTVIRAYRVPGTYYSANAYQGFASGRGPRHDAECDSLAYLASVAARALVFIAADHPALGVVCFVAIGMGEVSSCEIRVRAGQRVCKGEEIGRFHYGGSTYCLVFGPGAKLRWHDLPPAESPLYGDDMPNFQVNSKLATVEESCKEPV